MNLSLASSWLVQSVIFSSSAIKAKTLFTIGARAEARKYLCDRKKLNVVHKLLPNNRIWKSTRLKLARFKATVCDVKALKLVLYLASICDGCTINASVVRYRGKIARSTRWSDELTCAITIGWAAVVRTFVSLC